MLHQAGITVDHFEAMFGRWAESRGFRPQVLTRKTLQSILNVIQQQSPFAVETNRGRTILHLSNYKGTEPVKRTAVVYERDGEVWGVPRYDMSHKKKRKLLRYTETGFVHGVPDQIKTPIRGAREDFKEFFDPKQFEPIVFVGARLLHHRLIEARAVPQRRHGRKVPDVHFDHAELHQSLLQFMGKFEKRRRNLAAKIFVSALDQETFSLSQSLDYGNSQMFNWLAAQKNNTAVIWRRQVAYNHPLLTPLAAGEGKRLGLEQEYADDCGSRVTQAIDGGASLPDAVGDALFHRTHNQFRKAAIRHIQSLKAEDIPESARSSFYRDVQYLDRLNPNWYPRTPEAWIDYHMCIDSFVMYREYAPNREMMDLILETGGKWKEYANLIRAHGSVRDIRDWEQAITKKVINSRLTAEGPSLRLEEAAWKTTARKAYVHLPFRDVIEASLKWHVELEDFNTKIASLSVNQTTGKHTIAWEAIDQPKTAPNGIFCRPLTTPDELKVQHKKQKHCVDGYSSDCLYGASHIISLERDEEVLTTVELREHWDKATNKITGVGIAQHQGFRRRPPDQNERDAIAWYVWDLKPDWDKITAVKEDAKANRQRNSMIVEYGYNPYDAEARMRAFEICRPYFPTASQRNMSYDVWFERVLGVRKDTPHLSVEAA